MLLRGFRHPRLAKNFEALPVGSGNPSTLDAKNVDVQVSPQCPGSSLFA